MAITTGTPQFVPPGIFRVMNIGARTIDAGTILGVMSRLDLLDSDGHTRLLGWISETMPRSQGLRTTVEWLARLRRQHEAVLDHVQDAVVELIAENGPGEPYGDLIRLDDLRGYRVVERTPLHGTYRGYYLTVLPPSCSGGAHGMQMLNILEGLEMAKLGFGTPASVHALLEANRIRRSGRRGVGPHHPPDPGGRRGKPGLHHPDGEQHLGIGCS